MSIVTPTDQLQVDKSASEYIRLHHFRVALQLQRERGDRLQKAVLAAQMHLSIGDSRKAFEILTQALTA